MIEILIIALFQALYGVAMMNGIKVIKANNYYGMKLYKYGAVSVLYLMLVLVIVAVVTQVLSLGLEIMTSLIRSLGFRGNIKGQPA